MAKTKPTAEPEVLPAEVTSIQADAGDVAKFTRNLTTFFETARDLEDDALALLQRAERLKPPKTQAEDDAILELVREARGKKGEIEDHWTISGVLNRLHKATTKARGRGVTAADNTIGIGTKFHTEYRDAEERRAAAEQERLRREAESRAQQEREAELARIEADALKLEESTADLSAREETYIAAYLLNGGSAIGAARTAGYRDPAAAAVKLTGSEKIRAAIRAREEAAAIRSQAAAKREAPLAVQAVKVEANVSTKGERRTAGAELLDEVAFRVAVIEGSLHIPIDVLTVDRPRLNQLAKELGPIVNRWPGVRYKETTTIV